MIQQPKETCQTTFRGPILACSANFLAVYICTAKICGEYLVVTSHFFEFARLTPSLILENSNQILLLLRLQKAKTPIYVYEDFTIIIALQIH